MGGRESDNSATSSLAASWVGSQSMGVTLEEWGHLLHVLLGSACSPCFAWGLRLEVSGFCTLDRDSPGSCCLFGGSLWETRSTSTGAGSGWPMRLAGNGMPRRWGRECQE